MCTPLVLLLFGVWKHLGLDAQKLLLGPDGYAVVYRPAGNGEWQSLLPVNTVRVWLRRQKAGESCFDMHRPCLRELYGGRDFESPVYDKSYLYVVALLEQQNSPSGAQIISVWEA